jgi:uncharacterized membrane protein YeaQ/YmgE (transglycosylase-associated protein family)
VKGRGYGATADTVLGIGGALIGGWLFGAGGLFKQGTVVAFSLTALVGTIALVSITHYIRKTA